MLHGKRCSMHGVPTSRQNRGSSLRPSFVDHDDRC